MSSRGPFARGACLSRQEKTARNSKPLPSAASAAGKAPTAKAKRLGPMGQEGRVAVAETADTCFKPAVGMSA